MDKYAEALLQGKAGGCKETAEMDVELPEATILIFRRLAHAKVGLPCKNERNMQVRPHKLIYHKQHTDNLFLP